MKNKTEEDVCVRTSMCKTADNTIDKTPDKTIDNKTTIIDKMADKLTPIIIPNSPNSPLIKIKYENTSKSPTKSPSESPIKSPRGSPTVFLGSPAPPPPPTGPGAEVKGRPGNAISTNNPPISNPIAGGSSKGGRPTLPVLTPNEDGKPGGGRLTFFKG